MFWLNLPVMETFLLTFDPGDKSNPESGVAGRTKGKGGKRCGRRCGGGCGGGGDGVSDDWRARYCG